MHMVQLMPLPSQKTPSPLASFKSRLVLPSWYWLTPVVLEKRLLNGCSVVVVDEKEQNENKNANCRFGLTRESNETKETTHYL